MPFAAEKLKSRKRYRTFLFFGPQNQQKRERTPKEFLEFVTKKCSFLHTKKAFSFNSAGAKRGKEGGVAIPALVIWNTKHNAIMHCLMKYTNAKIYYRQSNQKKLISTRKAQALLYLISSCCDILLYGTELRTKEIVSWVKACRTYRRYLSWWTFQTLPVRSSGNLQST